MRVDTGSCGENSGEVGVMEVASGQEKKYQKCVNRGLSLMCRRRAKWRKCFPTHTVVEITSASVLGVNMMWKGYSSNLDFWTSEVRVRTYTWRGLLCAE